MKRKVLGKKKTLVIDRLTWNGNPDVKGGGLKDKVTGSMCCLGFWALNCGVPSRNLSGVGMPCILKTHTVPNCTINYGDKKYLRCSDFATKMAAINDDDILTIQQKERRIKAGFRRIGVKVTFIN